MSGCDARGHCSNILLVACIAIVNVSVVLSSKITEVTFANGCVLVHAQKDPSGTHDFSLVDTKPFLNCSGKGRSSFDLSSSDFPSDIKSISFANNRLESFDVDDLARFTSLVKLDFGYNMLTELQPSSENTSFSSMDSIDLRYNKLTTVPSDALSSFPGLRTLDISSNQIAKVSEDDFQHLNKLRMLNLGGNPKIQVFPTALQKFKTTLMGVTIQFSGLTEIPRCLVNLTSLIYVSLTGNQISYVGRDAFLGNGNLRWLELANNRIRKIDYKAFSGVDKLRSLDLSENRIEMLPYGVFDVMADEDHPKVEMYENPISCNCSMRWFRNWIDRLDYKDVRFKCDQPARNHGKSGYQVDPADFSCRPGDKIWKEDCSHVLEEMKKKPTQKPPESRKCPRKCKCYDSKGNQYFPYDPSAKRLKRNWWFPIDYPYADCSNAGYTRIPQDMRTDFKTLNFINSNFKYLRISDLKRYAATTVIYLEKSGISSLVSDRATVLRNVKYLSLQNNNITSVSRRHLQSFPNVKLLRISNNKIKSFERDMLQDTRFIKRLHLGPNPATNFHPSMISGLDLFGLSLRNLSLKSIPPLNFWNLTYLEISDNFITTIPNKTFAGNPNIIRLRLDNNLIYTIGSLAFANCSHLKNIDLSENLIETLPRGVFSPLLRDGLQIELWMNPINCNCRMKWFKQWIEEMDAEDPTTDIRFLCKLPWRTYGKTSNVLSPDQFTCEDNDLWHPPSKDYFSVIDGYYEYTHETCYDRGHVALAVILTMIFTSIFTLFLKWCVGRRRRKYHSAAGDVVPLAMDE